MTDSETLSSPIAQALRQKIVAGLAPYRGLVWTIPYLPAPAYVRDAAAAAVAAVDRWTQESRP